MEPVYFVMAILGCGDDGLNCQQQRVEPVRYRTVAECRAAIDTALVRNNDISFPVIGATCQRANTRLASAETRRR